MRQLVSEITNSLIVNLFFNFFQCAIPKHRYPVFSQQLNKCAFGQSDHLSPLARAEYASFVQMRGQCHRDFELGELNAGRQLYRHFLLHTDRILTPNIRTFPQSVAPRPRALTPTASSPSTSDTPGLFSPEQTPRTRSGRPAICGRVRGARVGTGPGVARPRRRASGRRRSLF